MQAMSKGSNELVRHFGGLQTLAIVCCNYTLLRPDAKAHKSPVHLVGCPLADI